MITINPNEKTYWILFHGVDNRYLAGITEANEVTEASDAWTVHLLTTTEQQWLSECSNLNISAD